MAPILRSPAPISLLAALLALGAWYLLGRPVPLAEPAVREPLHCLSYTPYRAGQSPFDEGPDARLDPALVEQDLRLLAGYTSCIRLYASGGMEPILPVAQSLGMEVLLGAWVSSSEPATRQEIEALVKSANAYPDTVRGVLVGNEALLRRDITPDRLTALIREVRTRVPQPVSYADVWEFQLSNPQVGEASDFVTIHVLPYWEDQPIAIDGAIAHVRSIRRQVMKRFPGKRILIGESGWPSVGRMREGALPSAVNEARFIRGFVAAAHAEGWDYNLIEAFDQPWKRQLEGAVGGYWGIFDTARNDKHLLAGDVTNHPQWLPFALLAAALATGMALQLRLSLALAPLAALTAFGWTLQLEQIWLIVRDPWEGAAAALLLTALLASPVAALARLARRPLSPRLEARAALLLGALGAVLSLWLVFDPRYRDFFIAGFLPATLLLLLVARGQPPVVRRGEEELAIGLLLLGSAIAIVLGEKVTNWQALAWGLSCLMSGTALLRRGTQAIRRSPGAA